MPTSYAIDADRLRLSETFVSPKGVKTAQLTADNEAIYWFPEPLEVAFEPRSFDGGDQSRVSLCFLATPTVVEQLANLDDAVVKLVAVNSQALFGKTMSEEMLKVCYTPTLYRKQQYPAMLRVKLITSGRNATKCWDSTSKAELAQLPEVWQHCRVTAKLLLKGLWFQGNNFGVTVELTDALVGQQKPASCPW